MWRNSTQPMTLVFNQNQDLINCVHCCFYSTYFRTAVVFKRAYLEVIENTNHMIHRSGFGYVLGFAVYVHLHTHKWDFLSNDWDYFRAGNKWQWKGDLLPWVMFRTMSSHQHWQQIKRMFSIIFGAAAANGTAVLAEQLHMNRVHVHQFAVE